MHDVLGPFDPDDNFFNGIFNSPNQSRQSEYCTIEQFGVTCNTPSSITVLHLNIRSFNANGDKLASVLDALLKPPEVIVLTETWITDVNVGCSDIDGYEAYHITRAGGRGGGVSVFYRNSICAVRN